MSDGTYLSSGYPARDRVEIVGNHSNGEYNIKLSDLQESDEGTYRCFVFSQTKEYKLQLLVAPSALVMNDIDGNKILGTEGNNLTINCTAIGGTPPPDLKLEVDSKVTNGTQTVQYTIPVLQRSHDKQLVKCQATNEALNSQLEETATLYLYLKPSTPVFNRNTLISNETQQLIVSCTSTGSRPAGVIYWKLKSNVITSGVIQQNTSDSSTDTYTVVSTLTYSVDRSYNGQPITCGVTHQALSRPLETTNTIHVNYPPNLTVSDLTYNQKDAARSVTCNVVGGNPVTYTYYEWQHKSRYGKTLRLLHGKQDGILILPERPETERYQDAGEYVCFVGNGIGDQSGNIQQKGYGYVTIYAQPVFSKDNSQKHYGETGKPVDIHIYVYSVPKYTTVKWSKGDRDIVQSAKYSMTDTSVVLNHDFHGNEVQLDGYRVTLTIKLLTEEDFSNYTLQLSNGYGQPVKHEVVLEFGIAATTPQNQCECNYEQNCTSQPVFNVVLTLAIATLLFWIVLGSIYYRRRKLIDKRDRSAYNDPKNVTSYDEVDTSTNRRNQRQEVIVPEIQLEQYETLGPGDKPAVYEQLETEQ